MVRIMIVLLLLGSAFLGWRAYTQDKEIKRYEAALAPGGEVDATIEKIQKKAFLYTSYTERQLNEGMKGASDDQDSVDTYLRRKAQGDRVEWGNIKIDKPKPQYNREGYVDYTYRVTHQDGKMRVSKKRIANMLFTIERDSRKMKVTRLSVRTGDSYKDEDIPEDSWRVDFDVSLRERNKKRKR